MDALPVIIAGLRRDARKPSLPWIRVAAAAMASLPFLFAGGGGGQLAVSAFGQSYFAGFTVVAAILAALGGQLATADSIGREAREGTLGLLFLTPLSRWDIVLGRIAAGGVALFSLLLAALPAAAIVWLLGGVSGVDWLRGMIGLLNLIFVSMAAGMVATAFIREAVPSFLAGFGILLAVGLLPFVMEYGLNTHHPALALHLRHLTPLSVLHPSPSPISHWAGYLVNLATSNALGWLMIFVAGMGVERTRNQLANPSHRRTRRLFRRRMDRYLDAPPARLLFLQAMRGMPLHWIGPAMTAAWLVILTVATRVIDLLNQTEIEALALVGCFATHCLWRLACAWQLTQFFYQGRHSGLFELVLTTPSADARLLNQVTLEVGARWIPAAMLMHLLEVVYFAWMSAAGHGAGDSIGGVVIILLLGILQLATLPTIALAEGLHRKSAASALAGVVLRGLIIPTILMPLCCLGMVAQILFLWLARRSLRQPIGEILLGLPSKLTPLDGIIHPLPPKPES